MRVQEKLHRETRACTPCVAVSMGINTLSSWMNAFVEPSAVVTRLCWETPQQRPPFTLCGCPRCWCWRSWREGGCSGPCGTSWSTTVVLLPHLRLHEMALHRAKMQGEIPPLAWYDGLEWKLLASQHWNLSLFLVSLSLLCSCLSCCLWSD